MVTPIVPPMERKKVAADVTVPSRCLGNSFCTTMVRVGITSPMPMPRMTMKEYVVMEAVSTPMVLIR
ncbi:hypothetical protein D3C73_1473820 [compost metagenome]